MRPGSTAFLLAAVFTASTMPAQAHHEVVFGPQSSLVLSGERYVTAQIFTRETGPEGERAQETTTVLGGGFAPTRLPFSLSFVVPFSIIAEQGGTRVGMENAIVAVRYRVDLPAIARNLGSEESYLLGVGGIELPTGTIDYDFGDGPPALVAGATFGIERRPFSVIGYGMLHYYAERNQIRDSGNSFLGAGFAWTPVDREDEGRLFSLQFGLSHERTFREELGGVPLNDTGGWAVVAHPTVVFAAGRQTLLFVVTSIPLADRWNSAKDEERFRIGAGAMVTFGR